MIDNTRHCWRSKYNVKSNILSDELLYMDASVLADQHRLRILQLCVDSWCNLEDLPEVMDDKDGNRVRELCAVSVT